MFYEEEDVLLGSSSQHLHNRLSRLELRVIHLNDNPAEDHEKDPISIRKLNRSSPNLSRLNCFVIPCLELLADVCAPADMILEQQNSNRNIQTQYFNAERRYE